MKMESKQFVKEQIKKLAKKYPFSSIKYYFDSFDNDHFICIGSRTDLNKIFSEQAWEIDGEFIEKFPNELLSFMLLEDYLEFGESGELIHETKCPVSLENSSVNFKIPIPIIKKKIDFEFKEETGDILIQSKSSNSIIALELDEEYAVAA